MMKTLFDKSMCDTLGGNETAPGGVCAPYAEGLDANKERPMTIVPDYAQAEPLSCGVI